MFDREHINIPLTKKVIAETRWYLVESEENAAVKEWIQVFASPQLPDVLLTRKEDGDHWWYEDVLYAAGNPVAVKALCSTWNRDHGYATEQIKAPRTSHRACYH